MLYHAIATAFIFIEYFSSPCRAFYTSSQVRDSFHRNIGILQTTSHDSADSNNAYLHHTIHLTPDSTRIGMAAALEKAAEKKWEVTICICDAGGTPLHVQRTANAFAASYDIACGKAKSAAIFAKSTGSLEQAVNDGRAALLSSPFVLMRGGLPLFFENSDAVVGAVGVSGVQPDQDEAIAHAAVKAISEVLTM